jgi:hypothetical protein
MKNKSNFANRSRLLRLNAARLHARISGRLSGASTRFASALGSAADVYGSPWSSLRLDLMKAPLTHYRE